MKTTKPKPKINAAARQSIKDLKAKRAKRRRLTVDAMKLEVKAQQLADRIEAVRKNCDKLEAECVTIITTIIDHLTEGGFDPEDAFRYATEIK